ncbi:MAG: DUF3466 family protein [Anaerolineae bacterium]|nr:DUF3466 family protein [Phycisphaerae bacterium]
MLGFLSTLVATARASYLPVIGADTGGRFGYLEEPGPTAGNGVGIGSVYRASPTPGTVTGYRWDVNGTAVLESGGHYARPYAINDAGTIVGAARYPARWDAGGTALTVLGGLDMGTVGLTAGEVRTVNNAGTSAGFVEKYQDGRFVGLRAVRWSAGQTSAEPLDGLGTDANGDTDTFANSINSSGIIVGSARKHVAGMDVGTRAVRWNSDGADVTELGVLGTMPTGYTEALAYRVNEAGTSVGYSWRFEAGASSGKRVAARWDGSGTAATALVHPDGIKTGSAVDINNAGTAIGSVEEYVDAIQRQHAMRWDAGQAIGVPLGEFGSANANSLALAINEDGITVGSITDENVSAAMWLPDGTPVRLNSLIDPA